MCIMLNDQAEADALQAQLRALGIDVEVRLARDFQDALAQAERLTGGRRRHFTQKPGGERPYDKLDGQKSIDFGQAAA